MGPGISTFTSFQMIANFRWISKVALGSLEGTNGGSLVIPRKSYPVSFVTDPGPLAASLLAFPQGSSPAGNQPCPECPESQSPHPQNGEKAANGDTHLTRSLEDHYGSGLDASRNFKALRAVRGVGGRTEVCVSSPASRAQPGEAWPGAEAGPEAPACPSRHGGRDSWGLWSQVGLES